jgi:hypothetical protein
MQTKLPLLPPGARILPVGLIFVKAILTRLPILYHFVENGG